MGKRGRGRGSCRHGAANAAACPGLRGTQHSLWKSSWQMLATAWAAGGPCRGLVQRVGGGGIREPLAVQNPASLVEVLGLLGGHTLVLSTRPGDPAQGDEATGGGQQLVNPNWICLMHPVKAQGSTS